MSFLFGQAWSLCLLFFSRSLFLHAARILSSSSFCLAILLAFCLLFSAMRQLLSDIEKLGCGCHTRAPKPISVSCVCRGAEARKNLVWVPWCDSLNRRENASNLHAKAGKQTLPGCMQLPGSQHLLRVLKVTLVTFDNRPCSP